MTMQISTSSLFSIPRSAVLDLQSQIAKAETEVTTGQIADPAQSLGSQLGLDETLQAQFANLTNLKSSNTIAQSTLSASQNALTQMASDAQSFVSAIMTAQSSGDVSTLPAQAQSLLASFTSLLNSTAGGAYIFGGTNSTVKPVADYSQGPQAATAAAFQGAFGMAQSDPSVSAISGPQMQAFLTGSFANLFQGSQWAANWSQASNTRTSALISPTDVVTTSVTANESALQSLANAYASIADLGIGNLSASARQAVLSNALNEASAAQQGITGLQATLGISQSQITNANSQMQTQASLIDNWVSKLGGVDSYQAASTLTNLTTQLETAYSLTNRISKLSLVNYLTA
jgi:flagellar hook-associated protein 3 FlgL